MKTGGLLSDISSFLRLNPLQFLLNFGRSQVPSTGFFFIFFPAAIIIICLKVSLIYVILPLPELDPRRESFVLYFTYITFILSDKM